MSVTDDGGGRGADEIRQARHASTEAWTDAWPPILAAHERELLRALGKGFDAVCFHGAPTDPQPGLAGTSGIAAIDATGQTGLDPFVRAIGALRRASATATAIFMAPATWEALGLVQEADGSNKPLVAGERVAADAPAESVLGGPRLHLAGHPARPRLRRGHGGGDRGPPHHRAGGFRSVFGFSRGAVGVRAIFRAKAIVGQPAGVAHITNLPDGP